MGVNCSVTRFAAATATGTQDITTPDLGGLTPVAVLFYATRCVTDATAADHVQSSFGAATGTANEWCSSVNSEHGVGTMDSHQERTDARCILFHTPGVGTDIAGAEFTSFIADGVRINWIDVDSAFLITAVFFAGTDISAHANNISLGNTANLATDITQPGFEPEIVIACAHNNGAINSDSTNTRQSIGFVSNDGATVVQRCLGSNYENGQALGASNLWSRDDCGVMGIQNNGTLDWRGSFGTFDANGFTATTLDAASGNTGLLYLALDIGGGVSSWVGTHTSPTSTGNNSETGPGFTPQVVLRLMAQVDTVNTKINEGDASGTYGFSAMDGDEAYSASVQNEDGSGTSDTQSISDDVAIELPDDDGTVGLTATFVSFDTSGWTDNYTAVKGTGGLMPALAIEEETAPIVVNVPSASLILTGFAPTILTPVIVDVPIASLSLSGFSPTVTVSVLIIVPVALLTLTGFIPSVDITNNKIINVSVASLSFTEFAPTILIPTIYYVDDATGNDSDDGLSLANAWLTVGKANSTLTAGDTVNIRAGTYNEQIKPVVTGTSGNPITYQQYLSEAPTIAGTTTDTDIVTDQGADKSYIVIDGLNISYGHAIHSGGALDWVFITRSGSTNWTIKNCTLDRTGTSLSNFNDGWNEDAMEFSRGNNHTIDNCTIRGMSFGIHITNGAKQITIKNCTITETYKSHIVIGDNTTDIGFQGILVEDNIFGGTALDSGSYTEDGIQFVGSDPNNTFMSGFIIRNNIFRSQNENAIDLKGARNILIEGNIIYGTEGNNDGPVGGDDRNSPGAIMKGSNTKAKDIIIRQNILYDNNLGVRLQESGYRIYNNTFVANNRDYLGTNQSQAGAKGEPNNIRQDGATEFKLQNNIMIASNESEYSLQLGNPTAYVDFNLFLTASQFADFNANNDWTLYNLTNWKTQLQNATNISGEEANAVEVADINGVGFLDVSNDKAQINGVHTNFNFNLKSTSPAINAGGTLTTTSGSGTSSTSVAVNDALYFFDGYGASGVVGDKIIVGNNSEVTITSIDYSTDTLTIDIAITWSTSDEVHLSFAGSGPDIGAKEYTGIDVPSASLTLIGFAPTVATTSGVFINVPYASFSLIGYVPVIVVLVNIDIPVTSLTISGYVSIVLTPVVVDIPTASLVFTGFSPTVFTPYVIIVPAVSLGLTGFVPSAVITFIVDIPIASLTLSGLVPFILNNIIINIPIASLSLVLFVPIVITSIPTAVLILSGFIPIIEVIILKQEVRVFDAALEEYNIKIFDVFIQEYDIKVFDAFIQEYDVFISNRRIA